MTKIKTVLIIFILLLFSLSCSVFSPSTATPNQPSSDSSIPLTEAEVPRVTAQEAKASFDGGEAIIVDVRSQAAYEASHVAGALSVPLNEFETNIGGIDLPKDQWIITYCT